MARHSPAAAAVRIDLIRVMDLLQTHITSALCQTVFRRVRITERQRVWTLEALVRFWTAVILRAPQALSQALLETLDQRDPLFPRIEVPLPAGSTPTVTCISATMTPRHW